MKKVLICAAMAVAAISLRAGTEGYFMLSVFSPGELPAPTSSIYGGRVSVLYGECHELYGIDLGVSGYVRERMAGAQFDLLWNGIGTDASGLQVGLVNTVEGDFSGLQLGLVGVAGQINGCQIGLVNVAAGLNGCQIGLLNFTTSRDWSFWPFINIGW